MEKYRRPDPDTLLEIARKEEKGRRGRLKVFFGMAAGVGKTYAMLSEAGRLAQAGVDVVAAYVETHGRPETDALCRNLPAIPRKQVEYRGAVLEELDFDAVVARRPEICLIDELAHTNAPGQRHVKRYQDILELLAGGTTIYTTLNVQHLESVADTVREITGVRVAETVPDSVLDDAEIELVDLPPEELLVRLAEGKVYIPEAAKAAAANFFREGNLTGLRELALRVAADRVGYDVRRYMKLHSVEGPWKTGHRLMVAVGPSPFSAQLVRWTKRLADSLGSSWLAVYVDRGAPLAEEEQITLSKHLELAARLGAEVIRAVDINLAKGLLRTAQQNNVTQLVVGKPGGGIFTRLSGDIRLRRLIHESGDIDVHVMRLASSVSNYRRAPAPKARRPEMRDVAVSLLVVGALAVGNWLALPLIGYRTAALVFLAGITVFALVASRAPVLLAGGVSALVWNFFFIPPRLTLRISSVDDAAMCLTYLIVALVLGELLSRIKRREQALARRERQATLLYRLSRGAAEAKSLSEVAEVICEGGAAIIDAPVVLLVADRPGAKKLKPLAGSAESVLWHGEHEQSVALWAFQHGQPSGIGTDNLPTAKMFYCPLVVENRPVAVLGIDLRERRMHVEERELLIAFLSQSALVMERFELQQAAEEAALLAESEKLSAALLDSVSHELRTPISALSSAAALLETAPVAGGNADAVRLLSREVHEAADRLNRLVGNLLDLTRIEAGRVQPRLDWSDIVELAHMTVQNLKNELSDRRVEIKAPPEVPLVLLDFVLIERSLANLLLNAARYTPRGTPVEVQIAAESGMLTITVSDQGPGLTEEQLAHCFEKFFRGKTVKRGGLGLGLSIVKGFVEVHGGTVGVANRPGGGAVFSMRLPIKEAAAEVPEAELEAGNPRKE